MRKLTNAIKNFLKKFKKRRLLRVNKSKNAESFKAIFNNYRKWKIK